MLNKFKSFQLKPKFPVRYYKELMLTNFPDGHLVHPEQKEYLTESGRIQDRPTYYATYIKDKIESRKRENELKKSRTMHFLANTRNLLPGCHKETVNQLRHDLLNFPEPTADIWDYVKRQTEKPQEEKERALEAHKTNQYKILNKLLKSADFPFENSIYPHKIQRNEFGFSEQRNVVRSLKSYCYYLKGMPQLKRKRFD